MAGRPFSSFTELSQATKDILAAQGFERATPVQEATIPLFAGNKDVAVDACTGSGKTLSFVIPIIEKLRKLQHPLKRHQVGAVIVSPTRELSRQIHAVAQPFVDSLPWLRSALLVGGSDPSIDVATLKTDGAHFLVGTPGRLDDILQRCTFLDMKTVEVLVLDEADRLLDMGFKAQVDSLMARLPRQRRTGLFSATQTEAVEALARAGLRNPVRVAVAVAHTAAVGSNSDALPLLRGKKRKLGGTSENSSDDEDEEQQHPQNLQHQITPSSLSVQYRVVETEEKLSQLAAFLAAHAHQKIIVYFLTCACVDYFAMALPRLSACKTIAFHSLHGRMKQAARESTLSSFASAPSGVLLATDVAARGLDIPDVHWVVQHDPPQDPAAFVHRCGRTARMGRSGSALAFLTPAELSYVDFLKLRKIPLVESTLYSEETRSKERNEANILENLGDTLSTLRKEAEQDRAVMEAGTKAFVSYIRAYKEHHCKYIFRLEDVPLGHLAASFALLRLPRMPELKKAARQLSAAELPGFSASTVDIDGIKFKEKAREKQRQAAMKQKAAAVAAEGPRLIKKTARKGANAAAASVPLQVQQTKLTAVKRRQLEARQELAELNDEYSLLRKLKKGKISEREYYFAAGFSSEDDGDDNNIGVDAVKKKGKEQQRGKNSGGDGDDVVVKSKSVIGVSDGAGGLVKVGARNLVLDAMTKKAKKKRKKERARVGGGGGAE